MVAVEPERRLAALAECAASAAPVTVTVDTGTGTGTVKKFADNLQFDAVVCSLWCVRSVTGIGCEPAVLVAASGRPVRYLEHVAGVGPRARPQEIVDATLWPRMLGNCHTHRHTEETIVAAGFRVSGARHGAGRRVRDRRRGQTGVTRGEALS